MKIKIRFNDSWKQYNYLNNGEKELKETIYTDRDLFPPKIKVIWQKNRFWGFNLMWLDYVIVILFVKQGNNENK